MQELLEYKQDILLVFTNNVWDQVVRKFPHNNQDNRNRELAENPLTAAMYNKYAIKYVAPTW